MDKKLVIIGASGHGKVVADIAEKNGYEDIIFLDDNKEIYECNNYPIVGTCRDIQYFREFDFIIAIGNSLVRKRITEHLEKVNVNIVTLIHPNSVIAGNVKIGDGTVVMAGTVINSCTQIGKGCIINTCSSVDHDCTIGEFSHVSVGTHIAGNVFIGNNTWIVIGATVSNNVKITNDCTIGAGAVVIDNLEEPDIYIGIPAKKMSLKDKINNEAIKK